MRYIIWFIFLCVIGSLTYGLYKHQRNIDEYINFLNSQSVESVSQKISLNPKTRINVLYTGEISQVESGVQNNQQIEKTIITGENNDQKTFEDFFGEKTSTSGSISIHSGSTLTGEIQSGIIQTGITKQEIIKQKLKEFEASKKSSGSGS